MQAVLKVHSQVKHYDPVAPDDHEPDVEAFVQDKIVLIHLVVVKVFLFVSIKFK